MIRERHGVILEHGGAVELDDEPQGEIRLRIVTKNDISRSAVLTLAEATEFYMQFASALLRAETQREQGQ